MTAVLAATPPEYSGLAGLAAQLLTTLGDVGVGVLVLLETLIPPIPSEVVLPFAGYLSQTGQLSLFGLIFWSSLGSLLGALVLYALGAAVGLERSIRVLSATRLVSRADLQRGAAWFDRHGAWSVLIGRLIPGIRSLISLPAGAARMNLALFCLLTAVGSTAWNVFLIGVGAALGTQHELIDQYMDYVNYAVYAAIVVAVVILAVRRYRQHRRGEDAGTR